MTLALPFARSIRAATTRSDRLFRLANRTPTGSLQGLSARAAVDAALEAYRNVPAYRAIVDSAGGLPSSALAAVAFLSCLPVLDKRNYVDRFSMADRCAGGQLPERGQLDESSGSTGTPYTWVRSAREVRAIHRVLHRLIATHVGADPIVLNGFSMGAWATGTTTAEAMAGIGLVKSTGPDVDRVLDTLALLDGTRLVLICGYPPFLRELIDEAERRGADLNRLRLVGVTGGEGMSEGLRARLEQQFEVVWSAYGASDLDIGVGVETPFSVAVRRAAAGNAALAADLFGTGDPRLPMVFAYDPLAYCCETVADELVVTVLRPVCQPRVRYAVHDAGSTVPWQHAVDVLRDHGLDAAAMGAASWRAPMIAMHGRSDGTVSLYGANLYAEDVQQGIDDDPALSARVDGFCLAIEEAGADLRPVLHLEIVGPPDGGVGATVARAVHARLARNSADYREAVREHAGVGEWRVVTHPRGTGPFVPTNHIKRNYVLHP